MREQINQKVHNQERISEQEALWLYQKAEMQDLRQWATTVRNRFHPPNQATYLVMRIINYTNICVALCDYCAFYRLPKSPEGYVLSQQQIFDKIEELVGLGGDFVGFNGGFNPKLKIEWYEELFSKIRARFGDSVEFYGLTVAELMYIAKLSRLDYETAAGRLKAAGVRWITGGGAEILTNAFRERHSPQKYTADDYMDAQAAIIRAGLNTTATMVIGFDETLEERVEHLSRVRKLQDETNGLFSLLSWTYKPDNTELGGQELGPEAYWRHLAISRLFLDNVRHIRTSVLTQNENALHGLHYGADDFDVPIEDQVTQLAGATINRDVQAVLAACRKEGFEPHYRFIAKNPANRFHPNVLQGAP
ncbi:MAG: radical SAM protein [Acidobacteria bacterium]|nr:radical SAM protein [Acidobacteriota bacterium]MCB9398825.1 radical SAM protein [Acidobacteriota bacterium]